MSHGLKKVGKDWCIGLGSVCMIRTSVYLYDQDFVPCSCYRLRSFCCLTTCCWFFPWDGEVRPTSTNYFVCRVLCPWDLTCGRCELFRNQIFLPESYHLLLCLAGNCQAMPLLCRTQVAWGNYHYVQCTGSQFVKFDSLGCKSVQRTFPFYLCFIFQFKFFFTT